MIKVQPVDISYVNQTWPLVETYIATAVEKGYPYPQEGLLCNLVNCHAIYRKLNRYS